MAKAKKTSKAVAGKKADTTESKSMIPEKETVSQEASANETSSTSSEKVQDQKNTAPTIRILYHGSCAKLTTRGAGKLEYEICIDDTTDESFLRIAGNASSGAYSTKWIALNEIHSILEKTDESFRAIVLRDLYIKQSSNNHGYLAAILKAEGVLVTLPKQPTVIQIGNWKPLLEKIDTLKNEEISLPDHIAIAAQKKAEKKAQILSENQDKKQNRQ